MGAKAARAAAQPNHHGGFTHMLSRQPNRTPDLADMLSDLGNPHPSSIARTLGVDERTARRWIKQNDAPRPALLALFWVTSWGRQWLDADMHNAFTAWRRMALAQDRELKRLQARADAMARALLIPSLPVDDQNHVRGRWQIHPTVNGENHEAPTDAN